MPNMLMTINNPFSGEYFLERFHFIYLTTNIVNGKIYVGQHTTSIIEDGYIGSGRRLIKAIKKHGRSNFVRDIICFCDSHEELSALEREIVNAEFVQRKDTYNIAIGGDGGFSHGDASRELIGDASRAMWASWSEEEKAAIFERTKATKADFSERDRASISAKLSVAKTRWWESRTEHVEQTREKIKNVIGKWWADDPDGSKRKKLSERNFRWWSETSTDVIGERNKKISLFWQNMSVEDISEITARRRASIEAWSDERRKEHKKKLSDANREHRLASSPVHNFENIFTGEVFSGTRHDFIVHTGLKMVQVTTIIYKEAKKPRHGWKLMKDDLI